MQVTDARLNSWLDPSLTRGGAAKSNSPAAAVAASPATEAEPAPPTRFAAALSDLGAQSSGGKAKAQISGQAAQQQFLQWGQMSTSEKIRESILQEYGLNETSLSALPPEEQRKIEDEIEAAIARHYGATGETADATTGNG